MEDLDDSNSNTKTTPYSTEEVSNNRQRHDSDFLLKLAKSYVKDSQRTSSILSRCGSNAGRLSSNSLSQKSQAQCRSLPIPEIENTQCRSILSPEIFIQVDPLHYLLNKVEKLSLFDSSIIRSELSSHLECKEVLQCYFPYAKVLRSILRCWSYLSTEAKEFMEKFRVRLSSNINGSFFLPEVISSSYELSQLYSSDILNDPEPARRLLFTILDMPEDSIEKLKIQLENFLSYSSKFFIPYSNLYNHVGYAQAMLHILKYDADFKSIKRGVAEIKSELLMQIYN